MKSNSNAIIDFSAQFGGRDAATVVLPHFKALKSAAKGIFLDVFPYPKLAFILRVDGDVNEYGFSGIGNPDIDKGGQYLSVDIGITKNDRHNISSHISSAILDSLPIINAALCHRGIVQFELDTLRPFLECLCERYVKSLHLDEGP